MLGKPISRPIECDIVHLYVYSDSVQTRIGGAFRVVLATGILYHQVLRKSGATRDRMNHKILSLPRAIKRYSIRHKLQAWESLHY
jgi:hypothetical protein